MSFSFVHCADLHLGRKPDGVEERFGDFGLAFERIAEYALGAGVDALLVAGDFFDRRSINPDTLELAVGTLSRLREAGLPVVAIEGNHDRANFREGRSWLEYLDGVGLLRLLKPEGEDLALVEYGKPGGCVLEMKGVRIVGLGYPGALTRLRLQQLAALTDTPFVLMLHAGVERMIGQDDSGVRLGEFDALRDRLLYAALGHIHARQETAGFLYNPGAPENVDIDEGRYKEKGFYHVVIEKDGGVQAVFHQSVRRPTYFIDVDAGPCADADALYTAVEERAKEAGVQAGSVVQARLFGRTELDTALFERRRIEELLKELGCVQVKVVDELNLPEGTGGTSFERAEVESGILAALAEELGLGRRPGLAGDILDIKERLLAGAPPEEVAAAVSALRRGGQEA